MLVLSRGGSNVFISEDLTALRAKLLPSVKRQDDVNQAFTREGRIICVMRDNSKVTVENPDDLFCRLGI